jgi:hypothetical protein
LYRGGTGGGGIAIMISGHRDVEMGVEVESGRSYGEVRRRVGQQSRREGRW